MSSVDPNTLCPGCFVTPLSAGVCSYCGFDPREPRPPSALGLGALVGHQFLVGRVLGKPGGFGITYLAFDRQRSQRVALKEYLPRDLAVRAADGATILPQSQEEGELFRYGLGQFMNEARTLAQLNHPNIVRVREFLEANGTAYLAMDYYRGVSLAEYLATQPDGRIGERTALALMQPVLDGLRAVHAQGFLHRDIKPANIYLAKIERGGVSPILLDFGAARTAIGERSRSLSVVVTDGYAPFEQYHRRGRQGPATDIYAAGAVLYRMLTGSTPPPAPERMSQDTLEPAARYGVSAPVSDAIGHALQVEAYQRPQTVQLFQQALAGAAPPPQPAAQPAPPPRGGAWAGDTGGAGTAAAGAGGQQRAQAFFPRLLRGDYGLAKTFWLYLVLVSVLMAAALTLVESIPVLLLLNLLFTGYRVVALIGTWRAADRFTGGQVWAVLAKIVVVIEVGMTLWGWVTVLTVLGSL
jgi:hypothetical protein